jgi:hypothetical protein
MRSHKALPRCSDLQPEAMRVKADCAEPLAPRSCAHQSRRRPPWTTRHPARYEKHADCRPLLQQSSPIRGRVVQPGKREAFPNAAHLVRLTDRHSIRTAPGAPGEPTAPHLECSAPGANASSFDSSFNRPPLGCSQPSPLGSSSGVLFCQPSPTFAGRQTRARAWHRRHLQPWHETYGWR